MISDQIAQIFRLLPDWPTSFLALINLTCLVALYLDRVRSSALRRRQLASADRAYDDMARLLALREVERTAIVQELDRVTILEARMDRAGIEVPRGATGTVVAVLKGGAAYMVEFTRPVAAVVTVRPGEFEPAGQRN